MLAAFTAGLLLISVSELGDKTFFIAAILAMRHSRRLVWIGAVAALALMTVLSVMMGQLASLFPKLIVQWAEVILFAGFGLKLLLDARRMSDEPDVDEQKEAAEAVRKAESHRSKRGRNLATITEAFGLTFIAEWGDRTQFTTIALAAANNPIGVTAGAILGHAICATIAVLFGRMVCGYLSERTLTTLGGMLFLVFAGVDLMRLLMA